MDEIHRLLAGCCREYLQPLYFLLEGKGGEVCQTCIIVHDESSGNQDCILSDPAVFPRQLRIRLRPQSGSTHEPTGNVSMPSARIEASEVQHGGLLFRIPPGELLIAIVVP